ncbi:Uncharacterized protein Fot_11392 [Forsythia ovata]|uniref:Uncharacterized protein n=1 Tax=Forsythia ovata TaxID=205694 RepID=A0ABD1WJT3_9LAMI
MRKEPPSHSVSLPPVRFLSSLALQSPDSQPTVGEPTTTEQPWFRNPLTTMKTNSYHFCKLSLLSKPSAKIKQTEVLKNNLDVDDKEVSKDSQSFLGSQMEISIQVEATQNCSMTLELAAAAPKPVRIALLLFSTCYYLDESTLDVNL